MLKKKTYTSLKNMWKTIKYAQNWASRLPYLPNIERSDGNYVIEPKEKIEVLKKVLLLLSGLADLLNPANFEHSNDLVLPWNFRDKNRSYVKIAIHHLIKKIYAARNENKITSLLIMDIFIVYLNISH